MPRWKSCADAAEAALIRDLATDRIKREVFGRLHEHFNRLADQVERAKSPVCIAFAQELVSLKGVLIP